MLRVMSKHPNFKADLFIFGIVIFLMGIVFSMFVLEKDPDARLGLFGISAWVLVVAIAAYMRFKKKNDDEGDDRPS